MKASHSVARPSSSDAEATTGYGLGNAPLRGALTNCTCARQGQLWDRRPAYHLRHARTDYVPTQDAEAVARLRKSGA